MTNKRVNARIVSPCWTHALRATAYYANVFSGQNYKPKHNESTSTKCRLSRVIGAQEVLL